MITALPVCLRAAILDVLARRLTAAPSLAALLEPETSYRPSLYPPPFATPVDVVAYLALAEGYDQAQALRGDARRAYRGEAAWWTGCPAPRRRRSAQLRLAEVQS